MSVRNSNNRSSDFQTLVGAGFATSLAILLVLLQIESFSYFLASGILLSTSALVCSGIVYMDIDLYLGYMEPGTKEKDLFRKNLFFLCLGGYLCDILAILCLIAHRSWPLTGIVIAVIAGIIFFACRHEELFEAVRVRKKSSMEASPENSTPAIDAQDVDGPQQT